MEAQEVQQAHTNSIEESQEHAERTVLTRDCQNAATGETVATEGEHGQEIIETSESPEDRAESVTGSLIGVEVPLSASPKSTVSAATYPSTGAVDSSATQLNPASDVFTDDTFGTASSEAAISGGGCRPPGVDASEEQSPPAKSRDGTEPLGNTVQSGGVPGESSFGEPAESESTPATFGINSSENLEGARVLGEDQPTPSAGPEEIHGNRDLHSLAPAFGTAPAAETINSQEGSREDASATSQALASSSAGPASYSTSGPGPAPAKSWQRSVADLAPDAEAAEATATSSARPARSPVAGATEAVAPVLARGSWPEAAAAAPTAAPAAAVLEERGDSVLVGGGEWPEAATTAWPQAAEVEVAGSAAKAAAAGSAWQAEVGTAVATAPAASTAAAACPESANGLRALITQLSAQLAEEVRRREAEEAELEARAAEKTRLLTELEAHKKRREAAAAAAEAAAGSAEATERQHTELAKAHRELRAEVAKQEEELARLREEAKARSGTGRDWARDGPEKDALVETKLKIAEAHDHLAQMKQQLWLNREGLRKQLSDIQAENARLRSGRWSPPAT